MYISIDEISYSFFDSKFDIENGSIIVISNSNNVIYKWEICIYFDHPKKVQDYSFHDYYMSDGYQITNIFLSEINGNSNTLICANNDVIILSEGMKKICILELEYLSRPKLANFYEKNCVVVVHDNGNISVLKLFFIL